MTNPRFLPPDCSESPWTNPEDGNTYICEGGFWRPAIEGEGDCFTQCPNCGYPNHHTDPCFGVTCGDGMVCVDGTCVPDVIDPNPGEALGGGYFGGIIMGTGEYGDYGETGMNEDGVMYGIIVADISADIYANLQGSSGPKPYHAANKNYGAIAYEEWLLLNKSSACSSMEGKTNAIELGGYSDWYIPAMHEQQIVYTTLKPTSTNSETSYGNIPVAVPPRDHYSLTDPAKTGNALFEDGGAQNYKKGSTSDHHSGYGTVTSSGNYSTWVMMLNGREKTTSPHTYSIRYRAIRRISLKRST